MLYAIDKNYIVDTISYVMVEKGASYEHQAKEIYKAIFSIDHTRGIRSSKRNR